jgi:hypothetical protein
MYHGTGDTSPQILKDKICLLCSSKMTPLNLQENFDKDSFEYKCDHCNPNTIIFLSGDVVRFKIEVADQYPRSIGFMREEVKKWHGEYFTILEKDFY